MMTRPEPEQIEALAIETYECEAAAIEVADKITDLYVESDGLYGWRAVAVYSIAVGGWCVHERPWIPGTCT